MTIFEFQRIDVTFWILTLEEYINFYSRDKISEADPQILCEVDQFRKRIYSIRTKTKITLR